MGKRSRQAILDLLKQKGPQDSQALAGSLGLTAMAVRQHLYELLQQKLVTFVEQPRPLGRPAKLWKLTPGADRFYPDGHANLTVDLLDAIGKTFGDKGLEQLVELRAKNQKADYARRITAESLERRLQALVKIRTSEGYMAELKKRRDGSYLLIENHCPICVAASSCQKLCGGELDVFRSVLGPKVSVERVDHILSGARRCAYRVQAFQV